MKDLSSAMEETLKDGNLQDVSIELAEVVLDSTLQDGVLKDIPILGTLLGITKTTASVRDYLFTKKLLTMLNQTKQVPKEKRRKVIDEIEQSQKYRTKVGEKVLFLVDKCDDTHKAELIGKLFKSLLNEEIDYEDFQKAASCVERTYLPTLINFIESTWTDLDIDDGATELISTGLMEIDQISPQVKVTPRSRFGDPEDVEYFIDKAKLKCSITHEGRMIRKYLI